MLEAGRVLLAFAYLAVSIVAGLAGVSAATAVARRTEAA
jgi:fluoride ion exporter CrcB/FEX